MLDYMFGMESNYPENVQLKLKCKKTNIIILCPTMNEIMEIR